MHQTPPKTPENTTNPAEYRKKQTKQETDTPRNQIANKPLGQDQKYTSWKNSNPADQSICTRKTNWIKQQATAPQKPLNIRQKSTQERVNKPKPDRIQAKQTGKAHPETPRNRKKPYQKDKKEEKKTRLMGPHTLKKYSSHTRHSKEFVRKKPQFGRITPNSPRIGRDTQVQRNQT